MPDTLSGVERFATEIAGILELEAGAVRPDSLLIADLDFDSLAFVELSILLMERYSSKNFMAAMEEIDVGALSVRAVFENYARAPGRVS